MYRTCVKYGIPYQGGKGAIAEWIYDTIFSLDDIKNKQYTDFYDLFCGGGAVSHVVLNKTNIPHIHANDITVSAYAIKWCVANANKPKIWANVLRMGAKEEYLKYKEVVTNPKSNMNDRCFAWWVLYVWGFACKVGSFGYSLPFYLNERVAAEYVLTGDPKIFNDFHGCNAPIFDKSVPYDERMHKSSHLNKFVKVAKRDKHRGICSALCVPQQLANNTKKENIKRYIPNCGDYREVQIQPNSLVYLDPPYKGKADYKGLSGFDSDAFYIYAESLLDKGCDVFCSEESAPSHWELLSTRDKTRSIGSSRQVATEHLYRVRKNIV